jgi:parallel beta-helix repeat protein
MRGLSVREPPTVDGALDAPPDLPARFRPRSWCAGRGGSWFAVADDLETGTAVFVKVADDGEAIRREAAILERIRHPAVVAFRGRGEFGGRSWVATALIEGPDLEAHASAAPGGRLTAIEIVRILRALAAGLGAVHAREVLHRDLKPANVMLAAGRTPVVVDFGAAAVVRAPRSPLPAADALTHGYGAPEQYTASGSEGPWTDVYGLAAIGWRLLTGHPPPPAPERLAGAGLPAVEPPAEDPVRAALVDALEAGLVLDTRLRPAGVGAWAAMLPAIGERSVAPADERLDDDPHPPTVTVERMPVAAEVGARSGDPSSLPADRRRYRRARGRWLAAAVAAALATGVGIRFGHPLYDRTLKRDWSVDAAGTGDVRSIGEALRRGRPDATIRIRPGIYAETVAIGGRQTLIAADPQAPPTVAPERGSCLVSSGSQVTLRGLTFRPPAEEGGDGCIVVTGGAAVLEGNRIADGRGPAVLVAAGARLRFVDNAVGDIDGAALGIRGGAAAEIVGNRIERSGSVVFAEGARGLFADNHLTASRGSALQIASGAAPEVRGNRIEGADEAGVFVYAGGGGNLEGNRIVGSRLSGVVLGGGTAARLAGNTIEGSGEHGILALDGAGGRIEGNTVRGSRRHGLVVAAGAEVVVGESVLVDNAEPQTVDARRPRESR